MLYTTFAFKFKYICLIAQTTQITLALAYFFGLGLFLSMFAQKAVTHERFLLGKRLSISKE